MENSDLSMIIQIFGRTGLIRNEVLFNLKSKPILYIYAYLCVNHSKFPVYPDSAIV